MVAIADKRVEWKGHIFEIARMCIVFRAALNYMQILETEEESDDTE